WPADEAVDDEALAVRRGDRTPRRAEVDSDVEDLITHDSSFCLLLSSFSVFPGVGLDSVEQRLRDLLAIIRTAKHLRFGHVRQATPFGEDGRHVSRGEYDERRALDAPVFEAGIDGAQSAEELLLNGRG